MNSARRAFLFWIIAAAIVATASASEVTTIPTDRELPSNGRLGGVSAGRNGDIYVSNFGASVWRVSSGGEVTLLDGSSRGSSGSAVDANGNLFQASFVDGRILRIAPSGEVETWVDSGLDGPVGLAVDARGGLYVCNCKSNSIARVRPDRSVESFATSPDFDCPNGIALEDDGDLVVVSFKNGFVVEVSPGGETRRLADVPEGGNAHVAATRDALYVTKIEANRIYRVTRDGRAEPFAGTGELGLADGPALEATLARPNGIAVSADGRSLVVDNLDGPWRGDQATKLVLRRIDLPAMDSSVDLADRVEHHYADHDGVKIHYVRLGEGPLLVMLHGFPDFWYTWRDQMAALAERYEVVAVDLRGYNRSDKPKGVENYGMRLLVGDVAAVIRDRGRERATVIGHDWGGAIAWQLAMWRPELVERLVILSVPHPRGLQRELSNNQEQQHDSEYAQRFQQEGADEDLTAEGLASWVEDPAIRERYVAAFERSDFEAMLNYYKANFPKTGGTPNPKASPPRELPHIQCPVLIIHGLLDKALHVEGHEGTWRWVDRDLTLVTMPEAGHFVQADASGFVTRTLRGWLTAHEL